MSYDENVKEDEFFNDKYETPDEKYIEYEDDDEEEIELKEDVGAIDEYEDD